MATFKKRLSIIPPAIEAAEIDLIDTVATPIAEHVKTFGPKLTGAYRNATNVVSGMGVLARKLYSSALEFGTVKMAARSPLAKAVIAIMNNPGEALQKAIESVIFGAIKRADK